MARPQPQTFYRLWCGRKRYSHWLANRNAAVEAGLRSGVTFQDRHGKMSLGPLAWIEVGERARPKARTITIEADRPW